jgi:density-regulated protein DRP1
MPGLAPKEPPRHVRPIMVCWYAAPPLLLSLCLKFSAYIYSLLPTDALEAATSTLSVDAQKRAAKDAQKKAAKAEAADLKHAATLASSKVYIKRVERNKRKYVTAVSGLEAFGLDLKKVAKDFGKKFATGSSVTKLASGGEEIVVQGDVSDEIEEFLMERYKEIPEDNIELIEDKKKKGAGAAG